MIKSFTITKSRFLEWYFDSGQDSENKEIREDLALKVIESLNNDNVFTIKTEDIFKECNKGAIGLCFTKEMDGFDDVEDFLEDVEDFELTLID